MVYSHSVIVVGISSKNNSEAKPFPVLLGTSDTSFRGKYVTYTQACAAPAVNHCTEMEGGVNHRLHIMSVQQVHFCTCVGVSEQLLKLKSPSGHCSSFLPPPAVRELTAVGSRDLD